MSDERIALISGGLATIVVGIALAAIVANTTSSIANDVAPGAPPAMWILEGIAIWTPFAIPVAVGWAALQRTPGVAYALFAALLLLAAYDGGWPFNMAGIAGTGPIGLISGPAVAAWLIASSTAWALAPARDAGRPAVVAAWIAAGLTAVAFVTTMLRQSGAMPVIDSTLELVRATGNLGAGAWLTLAVALWVTLRAAGRSLAARPPMERPPLSAVSGGRSRTSFWAAFVVVVAAAPAVITLCLSTDVPDGSPVSHGYAGYLLWPLVVLGARRVGHGWGWTALAAYWLALAAWPIHLGVTLGGSDMPFMFGNPAYLAYAWPPMVTGLVLALGGAACAWEAVAPAISAPWVRRAEVITLGGTAVWGAISIGSGFVSLAMIVTGVPIFIDHTIPFLPVPGALLPLGLLVASRAHGRLLRGIAEAERRPRRAGEYVRVLLDEAITLRAATQSEAVEAERVRLASELHAGVLPEIARLRAATAAGPAGEGQGDIARRLDDVEAEVRGLMEERRLVVLEELGLVEALEWLADRAEDRGGLVAEITVDDRTTSPRPPRAVERAAFRVAQLAVDNAVRHAGASRLGIEVLAAEGEVLVRVIDDGRGLGDGEPVEVAAARANRTGISDMRLQAGQVRARVDLASPPDGGTVVTFVWSA